MTEPQELPPHLVLIQPVRDPEESEGVYIPPAHKEAHVQLGWVLGVPKYLEENISVGDLVVWSAYKQKQAPMRQYTHWKGDNYWLHEDDILLVIEDW